nr:hypothetical protein [Flavobacterium piscinae]
MVLEDERGHSIIQQRTAKGIWHNLYEFPLIESDKELNEKEVKEKFPPPLFLQTN